jgi:hypothetical protein
MKADLNKRTREVFELEKSVELSGKDLVYLEAAGTKQKTDTEKLLQKLQVKIQFLCTLFYAYPNLAIC